MDIFIDKIIDKEPLYYKITDDKVINITGEGGSGKSTFSNQYRNNSEYIVVDYDLIIEGNLPKDSIEYYLRNKILQKYGNNFFNVSEENEIRKAFSLMYDEILETLLPTSKTIILDGTQLRFIDDVKKIKGDLIVLRPSIETCVSRSVMRKKMNNPSLTKEELEKYEIKRRNILYRLNPFLNDLILEVNNMIKSTENNINASIKR